MTIFILSRVRVGTAERSGNRKSRHVIQLEALKALAQSCNCKNFPIEIFLQSMDICGRIYFGHQRRLHSYVHPPFTKSSLRLLPPLFPQKPICSVPKRTSAPHSNLSIECRGLISQLSESSCSTQIVRMLNIRHYCDSSIPSPSPLVYWQSRTPNGK